MTKIASVSREDFDHACDVLWGELLYQDSLKRRTDDEAQDVPGFLTLARRYLRQAEDNWADKPGVQQPEGGVQVAEALHDLRKLAAIFVRAMIYNGIRSRNYPPSAPASATPEGRSDG